MPILNTKSLWLGLVCALAIGLLATACGNDYGANSTVPTQVGATPARTATPTATPAVRERPFIGDHWHAGYKVIICGQTLPPFPEPRPLPGIHTHGDGVVHIEPLTRAEEGRNANLGLFFRNVGVTLNKNLLRLPDGREFRNGGTCPDGSVGNLRLLVGIAIFPERFNDCTNFREVDEFERYLPESNDCIVVEFGP